MSVVENNKKIKQLLKREYPDVRVKKGTGTASGWSKIYITIPKPENCYCAAINGNVYGIPCNHCREEHQKHWNRIFDLIRDISFYHYYNDMSECRDQVNLFLSFKD